MKHVLALLVLVSFVAPAYGMGNGESKTRAEVKVHAAAARSADSKRRMDYDFQYEQAGTQEAPKFVERMISVNAHFGVIVRDSVHVSGNNRVAVIGHGNAFVHDLLGNTIVDVRKLIDRYSEIECGAISGDGNYVAVCNKDILHNGCEIHIINCDTQEVVVTHRLTGVKVESMVLNDNGQRLAVFMKFEQNQENRNTAQIIIFERVDRDLQEIGSYDQDFAYFAGIAISPDGKKVLSWTYDEKEGCLFDIESRSMQPLPRIDRESFVRMAFINNNEFAITSQIRKPDDIPDGRRQFRAQRFACSGDLRNTKSEIYEAPTDFFLTRMFVTQNGIYLLRFSTIAESAEIYDFDTGAKVHSYPFSENTCGHRLPAQTHFNAGRHLVIAFDGTVVQHADGGDKNPDGSRRTRCMVYDPLDKADDRKARAQRLRYQQAGKFGKAKINAQKAYSNAKELWRTDKKKFALNTATAVVVVAAGVAGIKYAKKKKPLARALGAWRIMGAHKK